MLYLVLALMIVCGFFIGLWSGWMIWGFKWYNTSEGIDRKFKKMKDF